MVTKPKFRAIKSTLLLACAVTFAFLLGEFVHDSGHYLCHLAYGNTQVRVHFDPFGGTRIIGANGLPDRVLAITSAAGPLANLIFGVSSFFLLWKNRHPMLLPLLLWGPVALIQEGVTFSLGLLTPGGDAEWIAILGIPPLFILTNGIVFLIMGLGLVSILLPLAGIKHNASFEYKFFILLAGVCSLMLIRYVHAYWVAPMQTSENLIPLLFSLILAFCVTVIHRPVSAMLD